MRDTQPETKSRVRPFLLAILIILLLVFGWYLILPILGITLALSIAALSVGVAVIVILCIATLLGLLFGGAGAVVLGIFAILCTVAAVIFFPIFFPILVPLLIVCLVIHYVMKRRRINQL